LNTIFGWESFLSIALCVFSDNLHKQVEI